MTFIVDEICTITVSCRFFL